MSIWCDDPSHPRPVPVRQFYPAHGRWMEWSSRAGGSAAEVALVDDQPFDPEHHRGRDLRYRLEIQCRRCRKPLQARQEKLYAALDGFAAAGVTRLELSLLAASLERITD